MISTDCRLRQMTRAAFCSALFVLVAATAAVGCGGTTGSGPVKYAVAAETNYERGMQALEKKDWIAAASYFTYIRKVAQHSKFAVMAELRLADAEFGAGEYPQAVESYRIFAKFHPTHEMVSNGYTTFRIGESYAKQITDESWIFPPSFEMDQTGVEEASSSLVDFLSDFPNSPYRSKAETLLKQVNKRLAAHEWYVARYYWDRDHPAGTVLRLRRLLEKHPGVGYDEEAMWLLGRAYIAVGMKDRARSVWSDLVTKFPTHRRSNDAKNALNSLPASGAPGATAGGGSIQPVVAPGTKMAAASQHDSHVSQVSQVPGATP